MIMLIYHKPQRIDCIVAQKYFQKTRNSCGVGGCPEFLKKVLRNLWTAP